MTTAIAKVEGSKQRKPSMNYDASLNWCGVVTRQNVQLVLQHGYFSAQYDVLLETNQYGFDALNLAIETLYAFLPAPPHNEEMWRLTLARPDGSTLEVDGQGEEELKEFVVGAWITRIEPIEVTK